MSRVRVPSPARMKRGIGRALVSADMSEIRSDCWLLPQPVGPFRRPFVGGRDGAGRACENLNRTVRGNKRSSRQNPTVPRVLPDLTEPYEATAARRRNAVRSSLPVPDKGSDSQK